MPFIVIADPRNPGEGKFSVGKPTRKDAFETAVGLIGQGFDDASITITDTQSGRVYQSPEFEKFGLEEL
jgi:hypothetical protein